MFARNVNRHMSRVAASCAELPGACDFSHPLKIEDVLETQRAEKRREAAELVTELAAGEAASAELHAKKLEEIEGLHLALRDSEDAWRQVEARQAAEREQRIEPGPRTQQEEEVQVQEERRRRCRRRR